MIAPVVTRGFGSGGSIPFVVTRGYGIGTTPAPSLDVFFGGGFFPRRKRDERIEPVEAVQIIRKKSHRKEVEEDVQAAIAELTHVAKAADDIAQAPVDAVAVHFQPTQARINEALGEAAQLVREALSAIQRTRLQMAMERAREAEQAMQLRMEMQERARLEAEAAVRKARRRRAAAFVAAYMFGEED